MARSPLFDALLRDLGRLRLAGRLSVRTGIPADEVLDMQRGLDRRGLLKLGLLAGAGPLLGRCGAGVAPLVREVGAGKAARDKSVVIVGAGMAGVHCAWRLHTDHGIRATVYEAQGRVGGRMFTDRATFREQDGMHCELGGEFIDTPQTTMQDLAKELGLELLDFRREEASLEPMRAFFGGKLYRGADLLAEWKPVAGRLDAAMQAITDRDTFPTYSKHAGGEALDRLDLASFLRGLQAGPVLGPLLDVAFVTEYGLETSRQSALNLLYLVETATDRLELYGASDERFHVRSGNDAIVHKLVAGLPAGAIETGHVLRKVTRGSDGRFVATFDKAGTAVEVKADHLVLTIPFTLLRNVDLTELDLPEVKKKAIAELGYGTNAKLVTGYDARPWRNAPYRAGGESYSDLGFQCTWETSRLQSATSKAGIVTNFTGGKHGANDVGKGTPKEHADEFVSQYEHMYPGVQAAFNGRVARMHWPSFAWSQGSYQCYTVGQFTGIRGAEGERVGNLHFAGEHCSLADAGFMEGAAATGADAAAEIAKDLGATSLGAVEARLLRRRRRVEVAVLKRRRILEPV
jgi:monoamine oxidase